MGSPRGAGELEQEADHNSDPSLGQLRALYASDFLAWRSGQAERRPWAMVAVAKGKVLTDE